MADATAIIHSTRCIIDRLPRLLASAATNRIPEYVRELQFKLKNLQRTLEQARCPFLESSFWTDEQQLRAKLIVWLECSRSIAQDLHDYVVISTFNREVTGLKSLRPSIRLLSVATTHISLYFHQASVRPTSIQPEHHDLAIPFAFTVPEWTVRLSRLDNNLSWACDEDFDYEMLDDDPCQPARFASIATPTSQYSDEKIYVFQEDQAHILSILLQDDADDECNPPPSARASSQVSACLRSRNRHRTLKEHLQNKSVVDSPMEYLDCAAWYLEEVQNHSYCVPTRWPRLDNFKQHLKKMHQGHPVENMHLHEHPQQMNAIYDTGSDLNLVTSDFAKKMGFDIPQRLDMQEPLPVGQGISRFQDVFPTHTGQRHFAIRAACCILAAFRPLTPAELFAASATRVLPSDPDWPFSHQNIANNIDELLYICQNFIYLNKDGGVHLKDNCLTSLASDDSPILERDAHLFMSLVCLSHLKRQPRLVLKPWLDFHQLEGSDEQFPLHRYVVTFWQRHCVEMEGNPSQLPKEIHSVIQAAWLAERKAESVLCSCHAFQELDLIIQAEALDVGLEVSVAHGFHELAEIYRKMGAHSASIESRHGAPALFAKQDADQVMLANTEAAWRKGTAEVFHSNAVSDSDAIGAERAAFDLSDWLLVEPLDAEVQIA